MNIWIFAFEVAAVLGIAKLVWFFLVVVVGSGLGECRAYHKVETGKVFAPTKNYYESYRDGGMLLMMLIVTPLMLWLVYWILTEAVMPPEMAQSLKDCVHSIVFQQVD